MDLRSRRNSDTSPERARGGIRIQTHPQVKPIRRLQIVYYLTRNGHLEHPHFMEITRFAHQPLRLRDVMERLTALRGKAMPSMYSWSCKRNYKNGYVWNDLAENDIIYPSDGAEYVLKGSELPQNCPERFQQGNISNRAIQEPNIDDKKQKCPSLVLSKNRGASFEEQEFERGNEEEYETEEEFELDEEKTSRTSSTTPHSRCSRGVSTEELGENQQQAEQPHKNPAESTHCGSSSSVFTGTQTVTKNDTFKRFEDGDPVAPSDSGLSRNSVLFQLISCGGNLVAPSSKVKNVQGVNKSQNLQKEVLCKRATRAGEEEAMMISCMSENPRFGNLQLEEKEYFSGSIVESMTENRVVAESVLKRSNSYNEERGSGNAPSGSREGQAVVEKEKKVKATNVKCIPRKKSSKESRK